MKKLSQLVTLTLILTFAASSIYGQDPYHQENETYSPAYMQSHNTAHWSVYVPLAVLAGAAICFGLADSKREHHDSSDSKDALGSIANSRRQSHSDNSSSYSRRSSSSYKAKQSTRSRSISKGSHGHH